VIVIVSKPPSPGVATQLLSAARSIAKPVVIDFIGYPLPAHKVGNLHFAISLNEAAEIAANLSQNPEDGSSIHKKSNNGYLRGLFSGGTLAYEAMLGFQATLSPLYSNGPITNNQLLKDPLRSEGHTIIDLGDEFFMVGRLHPMIDNDLRIRRMKQEAADPAVSLILFDVVLGEGSHPNPANELAPVIAELKAKRPELEFVAIVIGTQDDFQDIDSQINQLTAVGVVVYRTLADAVNLLSTVFSQASTDQSPSVNLEQLSQPFAAINVGLESFYESLISQGAQAIHVEWRPPAGGNERLAALLQKMKK
jgi:FdrA protein